MSLLYGQPIQPAETVQPAVPPFVIQSKPMSPLKQGLLWIAGAVTVSVLTELILSAIKKKRK